jgi:hypothetical protein
LPPPPATEEEDGADPFELDGLSDGDSDDEFAEPGGGGDGSDGDLLFLDGEEEAPDEPPAGGSEEEGEEEDDAFAESASRSSASVRTNSSWLQPRPLPLPRFLEIASPGGLAPARRTARV